MSEYFTLCLSVMSSLQTGCSLWFFLLLWNVIMLCLFVRFNHEFIHYALRNFDGDVIFPLCNRIEVFFILNIVQGSHRKYSSQQLRVWWGDAKREVLSVFFTGKKTPPWVQSIRDEFIHFSSTIIQIFCSISFSTRAIDISCYSFSKYTLNEYIHPHT